MTGEAAPTKHRPAGGRLRRHDAAARLLRVGAGTFGGRNEGELHKQAGCLADYDQELMDAVQGPRFRIRERQVVGLTECAWSGPCRGDRIGRGSAS